MRFGLFLVLSLGFAFAAFAEPPTIFLVRHAERADAGGVAQKDPALSKTGRARATALAQLLRDAQIKSIYVTPFRRTQETAQPLAERIGVKPQIIDAKETAQLVAKLKASEGNALVVGHSNTLPEIMQALDVSSPLQVGEGDYDDLFLVVLAEQPRLIHLHYRSAETRR